MKRKTKNGASIYQYLDSLHILDTGTESEIAAAKKAYWKEYRAKWRNARRKQLKQVTLELAPDEYAECKRAAKARHSPVTTFMKAAAFAYMRKRYIVNLEQLRHVEELLLRTYSAVRTLLDEEKLPFEQARAVLDRTLALQEETVRTLSHPVDLELEIARALTDDPRFKERLAALLNAA